MPEPMKHAENRNWLETLLRRVPGFRGYLEREYRRESDELQRQWLADELQRAKRALASYARTLAEAADIDTLPQLDRLRVHLDRLIGRITTAMQGYSGVFDLVQIREEELDRVYEHDVQLMKQVESLADEIEKLPATALPTPELVFSLLGHIELINQEWDRREDILKGLD